MTTPDSNPSLAAEPSGGAGYVPHVPDHPLVYWEVEALEEAAQRLDEAFERRADAARVARRGADTLWRMVVEAGTDALQAGCRELSLAGFVACGGVRTAGFQGLLHGLSLIRGLCLGRRAETPPRFPQVRAEWDAAHRHANWRTDLGKVDRRIAAAVERTTRIGVCVAPDQGSDLDSDDLAACLEAIRDVDAAIAEEWGEGVAGLPHTRSTAVQAAFRRRRACFGLRSLSDPLDPRLLDGPLQRAAAPTAEEVRSLRDLELAIERGAARPVERNLRYGDLDPWTEALELGMQFVATQRRDLSIAGVVVEAWVRKHSLAGLRNGLNLVLETSRRGWDELLQSTADEVVREEAARKLAEPVDALAAKIPEMLARIEYAPSRTFHELEAARRRNEVRLGAAAAAKQWPGWWRARIEECTLCRASWDAIAAFFRDSHRTPLHDAPRVVEALEAHQGLLEWLVTLLSAPAASPPRDSFCPWNRGPRPDELQTALDPAFLAEPLPIEAPCGPEPRSFEAFREIRGLYQEASRLERAAADDPENEWRRRDEALVVWTQLVVDGVGFVSTQCRDLETAALAAEAWLRVAGPRGLRNGLALVLELLRRWWDSVHPLGDEADLGPLAPEERLAEFQRIRREPIESLGRRLPAALLRIDLTADPQAEKQLRICERRDERLLKSASRTRSGFYGGTLSDLAACEELRQAIEALYVEKCGGGVRTDRIKEALEDVCDAFREFAYLDFSG